MLTKKKCPQRRNAHKEEMPSKMKCYQRRNAVLTNRVSIADDTIRFERSFQVNVTNEITRWSFRDADAARDCYSLSVCTSHLATSRTALVHTTHTHMPGTLHRPEKEHARTLKRNPYSYLSCYWLLLLFFLRGCVLWSRWKETAKWECKHESKWLLPAIIVIALLLLDYY